LFIGSNLIVIGIATITKTLTVLANKQAFVSHDSRQRISTRVF